MGLTRDMGSFLAGMRREKVPDEALPIVVTGFTDCVGVMLAGFAEPVTAIVAKWAGLQGPVTRLASLDRPGIPAPETALIYGTAAHALDYDDTSLTGHPSAVLVPAILAEAQEVGADGQAMAAAYIAGFELWAELTEREPDTLHQKGWHPSAMYGAIAAAGASAVLRGHDADMATRAVAIAASLASGVCSNFGSMTKPFHLGRTAQNGLVATRLAEAGMTSADDALEHDLGFLRAISPERRVDTKRPSKLGSWYLLKYGINVKLYPVCFGAHRTIDATVQVCASNGIDARDIAAVDAEISVNSTKVLRNHRPQTDLEAKFSAEFAVAAAALMGRCGPQEVATPFVLRPDVQDLMGKVRVLPLTEKDPEEPARSPFDRVTVTLKDGRRLVSEPVTYARGHFKRGVEREVMWSKFSDCAAIVVDRDRAARLFQSLQNLASLRDVSDLNNPPVASAAE